MLYESAWESGGAMEGLLVFDPRATSTVHSKLLKQTIYSSKFVFSVVCVLPGTEESFPAIVQIFLSFCM